MWEGSFCKFLDHYTLSSTFLKKRTLEQIRGGKIPARHTPKRWSTVTLLPRSIYHVFHRFQMLFTFKISLNVMLNISGVRMTGKKHWLIWVEPITELNYKQGESKCDGFTYTPRECTLLASFPAYLRLLTQPGIDAQCHRETSKIRALLMPLVIYSSIILRDFFFPFFD